MTRTKTIRVNETDLQLLKAAKSSFDTDVPLGYVARVGAEQILAEDEDENEGGVRL